MTARQRKRRRQQLDHQLCSDSVSVLPARPQGGWIEAIREALGMTLDAFGGRLGVTRQTAHQLEQAEASGTITLKRLRAAAAALDCELIILLRPNRPLEEMLRERARAVAKQVVTRTGHSMAMEDQAVSQRRMEEMIEETADELINNLDPRLWQ